jgi:cation transport protein ChaC
MHEFVISPNDTWVFGYGSLMWDGWEKAFDCKLRSVATLPGYRRTFNKPSTVRWGTKRAPCPTLNVQTDASASCTGMAFAFAPAKHDEVIDALRRREGKGFEIRRIAIRLGDGSEVEAFAPFYAGDDVLDGVSTDELVRMIRAARGNAGAGFDYVRGIAAQLETLGIDDAAVRDLWSALSRHTTGH